VPGEPFDCDLDEQHREREKRYDRRQQEGIVVGEDVGLAGDRLSEQGHALPVQQRPVADCLGVGARQLPDALRDQRIAQNDLLGQNVGVELSRSVTKVPKAAEPIRPPMLWVKRKTTMKLRM
jgi:hypothetical protein